MNPKAITTIVMIITSGAILIFLLWPKVAKTQELRAELQDSRADFAIAEQKFERTKKAIRELANLSKNDIGLVEHALPAEPDLPDLFVLLNSLISRSGLVGEDAKIVDAEKGLDITFTLHGGYESFKSFLKAAEKSLRIFDVVTITFSSQGREGGDLSGIVFLVKMKTYIAD